MRRTKQTTQVIMDSKSTLSANSKKTAEIHPEHLFETIVIKED